MESLELINSMPQDMTMEEKKVVQDFISDGCPGILKVQQSDVFKWFELYMAGKTYAEIATITKSKKDLIMYVAYKSTWMDKRFKHYEDISLNMLEKIKQVKLDSANTLSNIIKAFGKYCDKECNRFLSNNDASVIDGIDTKVVAQYFKAIDLFNKLINPDDDVDTKKNPQQSPLVNINMGVGSATTVKQIDSKTLEITDETAGDLLKSLASLKKSHEEKK